MTPCSIKKMIKFLMFFQALRDYSHNLGGIFQETAKVSNLAQRNYISVTTSNIFCQKAVQKMRDWVSAGRTIL